MMMDNNEDNAITLIKDSTLQVYLPSSSIKITIEKDERLEHLDIPKRLNRIITVQWFYN